MLNDLYNLMLMSMAWFGTWPTELASEMVAFGLVLSLAGLANLEHRFPKIIRPVKQTRLSFKTNMGLFVFNNLLMSACSISALFMLAGQYSQYGLLNYVPSLPLKVILSFLAFDLLLYGWHRACHRVDAFWRFHRVHHNDPYLNVSTAFRLHFVEVIFTNILKALLMVILGIDTLLALLVESVVTACILFHHTNISFKHEQLLGRIMIVPCLHRVHHSTERHEHDHNYGAVLSLWDRIFGTYSEHEPKQIGIKGSSPQDFFNLLKFGLGLDKPVLGHPANLPANLDKMIAEAAYYRAERRHFSPGYELRDWLEAKKEIMAVMRKNNTPNDPGLAEKLGLPLSQFNLVLRQFQTLTFRIFNFQ